MDRGEEWGVGVASGRSNQSRDKEKFFDVEIYQIFNLFSKLLRPFT